MKCDGMTIIDRKISAQVLQRHGKNWRLEDEEQAENIALDPQRRSMIMRHMAESTKDQELTRMMDQVSNPGQVAREVRNRMSDVMHRTWVLIINLSLVVMSVIV